MAEEETEPQCTFSGRPRPSQGSLELGMALQIFPELKQARSCLCTFFRVNRVWTGLTSERGYKNTHQKGQVATFKDGNSYQQPKSLAPGKMSALVLGDILWHPQKSVQRSLKVHLAFSLI